MEHLVVNISFYLVYSDANSDYKLSLRERKLALFFIFWTIWRSMLTELFKWSDKFTIVSKPMKTIAILHLS